METTIVDKGGRPRLLPGQRGKYVKVRRSNRGIRVWLCISPWLQKKIDRYVKKRKKKDSVYSRAEFFVEALEWEQGNQLPVEKLFESRHARNIGFVLLMDEDGVACMKDFVEACSSRVEKKKHSRAESLNALAIAYLEK